MFLIVLQIMQSCSSTIIISRHLGPFNDILLLFVLYKEIQSSEFKNTDITSEMKNGYIN